LPSYKKFLIVISTITQHKIKVGSALLSIAHVKKISEELSLKPWQVAATVDLIDEDATVPFISRYRKEATGSLDELQVTIIRDRVGQLRELDKRREAILKSLEERELLTDELKEKIDAAETKSVLEDIYLPFKPKRRTRATIAKEKGLEPLALLILEQENIDVLKESENYIDSEKGVETSDDALSGARDIISEIVNENQEARAKIRNLFSSKGLMKSEVHFGKEEEGNKYKDYFEFEEAVSALPSHRIMAMFRGEREGYLFIRLAPQEDEALNSLEKHFIKASNNASEQVKLAIKDGYNRLLAPSMETEIRMILRERAEAEAIRVFSGNLKQLLLAPPLGQKNVLALDPGFRTGCKVVCLNKQGKLLYNDAIYPHPPQNEFIAAEKKIKGLVEKYDIEIIAVGNGTAGRETEGFCRKIDFGKKVDVVMVNESGASVYSASEVAREEFADYDLTVRGAVSIGRRLMDPLAELVKIDPKAIGVGQYQHDVNQTELKKSLDDVVVSCVNAVGVEVNTASKELLTYVSGLNNRIAKSIVERRDASGPFKSRDELKEVPFMGPKAFEQASGFLRILSGKNPLDSSAVHPESYEIVYKMAEDLNCKVEDLMTDASLRKKIKLENYVSETVGLPTLSDIVSELAKPGRDPREKLEIFNFSESVTEITDLKPGMKLPGVVTNITNFGVFVDIGVHQDGLVHISELSDSFVENPADVVKVNDKVNITVLEVDVPRKRISLSMKSNAEIKPAGERKAKVSVKKSAVAPRKTFEKNDAPKSGNATLGELLKGFKFDVKDKK
jgi:uncharacterized protein